MAGVLPYEDLRSTYNALGSPYAMHCDMTKIRGCDFSAGSLGHGLSAGVGMALGSKIDAKDYRVFVMIGIRDVWCSVGPPEEMFEQFGLSEKYIKEAAKKVLKRKR